VTSPPSGEPLAPALAPHRVLGLTRRQRARLTRWSVYLVTLVLVALVAARVDWAEVRNAFWRWELVREQFPEIVTRAAKNTLHFTALAFVIGIGLGLLLALMRLSSSRPYRWAAAVYIEVLRGLPALLTLLLVGFGLPIALDGFSYPNRYLQGALPLGLIAAAYIAETLRAGIQAVPRGQVEAARSLGMTPARTTVTIVLPQALASWCHR
jgi:polar amino acid transport system permease protein